MPIRAVVFDLFDTLVDLSMENIPYSEFRGRRIPRTALALHEAVTRHADLELDRFLQVLGDVDRELRESRHARQLEIPTLLRFETVTGRLGIDDAELPHELLRIHMGRLRDQVREVEHHPRVLSALRGRVRIGLCSNFSHTPTALAVLEGAGLREHFDAIVISDEVGIRKPRPEIFRATLDALDVEARETLHVGDSLTADVAGAAALEIRTVWLTRRVADPERALADFEGPKPDWQIADLAELEALIASADGA